MYLGIVSYFDSKQHLLKSLPSVLIVLFEILLFTERRDSILSNLDVLPAGGVESVLSLILAMYYSIFVFLWLTVLGVMFCCSDV
jgi:uncharacterized membrane protein